MKKNLILLNGLLTNFWFVLLLVTGGGWLLSLKSHLPQIFEFYKFGGLDAVSAAIGNLFFIFFLPLALVSLILSSYAWRTEKEQNHQGFLSLIIIIVSFASLFLFWGKITTLNNDIASGRTCIPIIGGPNDGQCERAYKN
jgi:uncharacterized membrane protein YtjA (UPF0391 family)